MKTTAKSSIFYSEFQAFIAPLQDENQTLKQEVQEWKDKYHSLLEQLRLAKQQRFDRSSEAHVNGYLKARKAGADFKQPNIYLVSPCF